MIYGLLLLFFFLDYVRPSSYVPALLALHLNSIVPLSAFAGSIVTAPPATVQYVLKEGSTKAIFSLMGLVWFAFLVADVQEYVMNAQTILLGFVLVYWVIATEVHSVGRIKGVIITLILVHVIVAALNPVLFTDPQNRHYISSGAFLGDGNDFSLSIDLIIPLCLFLVLDARKKLAKLVWLGSLLVLVAGVVATQSRGGTLGLGAAGLYYWSKSSKKLQTGAIAIAVIVLIFALAPGAYFARIASIGDTGEGSAQGRLTAWGVAVRMAVDNPLFGVGPAHFGVKLGSEYRPADYVGSGMTAHSMYFLALGELGVPGLICLLWLIGYNLIANQRTTALVQNSRAPTRDSDLQLVAAGSAAMIALAVAGAFLSALYYPHLYVLSGLLTAIRKVVSERSAASAATPEPKPTELHVHWSLRQPTPAWSGRAVGGRR